MPKRESDIPVGSQFTPKLVDLRAFLQVLVEESGYPDRMRPRIWKPPVRIAPVREAPTERRENLPLEAARQYGLLDDDYRATPFAQRLAALAGRDLYVAFARHILLELGGLRVVEGAQQMTLDKHITGVSVTGDSLAAYLSSQGFRVGIHNTQINAMRMWLEKAEIFSKGGWKVDPDAKARLSGVTDDDIAALVGLSPAQRAFALALCRLDPKSEFPAAQVRELAEQILGKLIERGSLPRLMAPLAEAEFITIISGGTKSGKSAKLRTTPKFRREILESFLTHTVKHMDGAVTAYYREDLGSVLANLDAKDPQKKGRALEAYAIQIMRLLGLRFVKWRLRAPDTTGNAEVDVVMAGLVGGIPTRWQVQCKNEKKRLDVESVAKEVGLAPLTKATHILVIARGGFTRDAVIYAKEVMRNSPFTLFLLGQEEFNAIRETGGGALAGILRDQAETILQLPRTGLDSLESG